MTNTLFNDEIKETKTIKSKVVAVRLPLDLYNYVQHLADEHHATMHSYLVTLIWNTTHWKKEIK
jgi:hypothetical protein